MKLISTTILALAISAVTADHPDHELKRPKQGVFLLSNQPNNQVGVYESLDDGSLIWEGRYDTGGIGYPDPSGSGLDNLGSSNAINYHTWNNTQWLVAANAGGPEGDASVTLFEVKPDLQLVRKDIAPLDGVFACSVAGFGDRVCAVTCALDVTLECFRITEEGTLTPEFSHNFDANLPEPEERPNSVSAAYGPGNILFSPEGGQVGIVMKGNAYLKENSTTVNHHAGLWSFPVNDRSMPEIPSYGNPSFFRIRDTLFPFAFTWRPGPSPTEPVAAVVNIAGESQNFPKCSEETACRSSITTIATTTSVPAESRGNAAVALEMITDEALDVIDGCWIEYRNNHIYTGNFFSDSITVAKVTSDGAVQVERTIPVGVDSVPNDLTSTGPKLDGTVYIYTENQGTGDHETGDIGVLEVLDDGHLQVHLSSPLPSGRTPDSWVGNNGLTSTLISEEELFALYGYKETTDNQHYHHKMEETSDAATWGWATAMSAGCAALFAIIF